MTANTSGFVDVELSRPLEIDGASVTKLRLREPTVADQLAADEFKGGEAAKEIFTMANLCQVSPDDLKKLTLRDYKKLQEAFLGFIS
jgi:Phage tail assembly chaperone proteins, E, or 41 or 14